MPKIAYIVRRFSADRQTMIDRANGIIQEYAAQGYDLTLRQLYYQFVARDLLPNTQQNYKRLGETVNDGRLAGQIDWTHIVDRTRELHSLSTWSDPAEMVEACARQYRIDRWADQNCRVEVWVEKEALAGVFERVCDELRIDLFACRGYTSASEMWSASQRHRDYAKKGQKVVILHFGDHDPSGIDMTRDIQERMDTFDAGTEVIRVALNRDQIDQYEPPPNPAKQTDSRFADYEALYGDESWELDALDPAVLADLVRVRVEEYRDDEAWESAEAEEEEGRQALDSSARAMRRRG